MIADADGRCALQGPVTIANVRTLLEDGNRDLRSPETVLDLAGVTEVDSTALSLLLEWRRRAAAEKRSIRFLNPPANLRSLAELYGVTGILDAEGPGL